MTASSYDISALPTHSDTSEALAVSDMKSLRRNRITSAYAREKQLLLGHAPTAVEAGGVPVHGHSVADAFRLAGADFVAETRQLAFARPDSSPEDGIGTAWAPISRKFSQAVVRTDTNQILGVVGGRYTPLQQSSMIELFQFLREDVTLDNIVAIRNGAKVVASASINVEGRVGDTKLCRFLHAANSFDGTCQFSVAFSDMMWVCANQITYITGKGAKKSNAEGLGITLRHTASAEQLAKQLPQLIDLQAQRFHKSLEELQPMATAQLSREAADYILRQTFSDKLAKPISVERGSDELRERTLADLPEVDTIRRLYAGGGIEIARGTVWGLFQAITEQQSHDFPRDSVASARARLEALWGGSASQRIDRAREACLTACAG